MTVSHQNAPRGKFDFETASKIDLAEVGPWRYAQDPSTFILCLSYRLPGWAEPKLWLPKDPFPQEIIDFVSAGGVVCAHNVAFEKAIWYWILHKRMGVVMPTRWRCSLAVAAYRSLPMGLGELGRVLGVEQIKDDTGKDLLRKLSQPQRVTKKRPQGGFITPEEAPDLHAKLHAYCMQDVRSEDAVDARIGDLPPPEYRTWVLDQIINQRGVRLDMKAVRGALDIVAQMEKDLTTDLQIITGGAVNEATEVAKIKDWCDAQGWYMEDMTATRVGKTIKNPDCPEHVRKVLRIRQQLGMASTKKLYKMLECVCSDGRVHDMLQYHGAGTGRWAGRTVQPQNFPRGDEDLFKLFSMEQLIGIIRHGSRSGLQLFWDETKALKSCLRGMFIPEDDATFYNADFSAIEARMTSWIAGEQWKLDAFEAIDRGEGYKGSADIYCAAATPIFGYTVLDKKTHPAERQVGKVCELAFGYQGSVGAWRGFDEREPNEPGFVPDAKVKEYCEAWRDGHPRTKDLWYGLDDAAVEAVGTKGIRASYRTIDFECLTDAAGEWMTMILPNGRRLWYYKPFVSKEMMPWGKEKWVVNFWGKDSKRGGAWTVCRGYGGLWTENAVQAASRDCMVEAMFRVEDQGYPIVLTVHDEVMAERKDGTGGSIKEFNELMSIVPTWCPGLPMAVDGWAEKRYRK